MPAQRDVSHHDQFQRLARIAEDLAVTAEQSARVHEQLAARLPGAADHAARDRLFAAAERAAAESYRAGRLPPHAVRTAIRASSSADVDPANLQQRTIEQEQRDTEYTCPSWSTGNGGCRTARSCWTGASTTAETCRPNATGRPTRATPP
ncbi:hypothetical protein OHA21_14025 [Actinoplanes sp. NBC_00393]|uniref:hypothetical protein n=1 Tax=Actinoplanes sp. NBC_00393 TaxID=2975953 RepID=UPI002E1A811E